MTTKEYERFRKSVDFYPKGEGAFALGYYALGITGEAGEVADKIKKVYRDHGGVIDAELTRDIGNELGDVLWYLTAIADMLGFTLEDVIGLNVAKLRSRRERGTQRGSGDDR